MSNSAGRLVTAAAPLEDPPMPSSPNRQQVDTGKLWQWVDRLTRDRRQRLVRQAPGQKKPTVEYVPIPSLWTQLVEAIASTDSGGGRGASSSGSRSPLDLPKLALMQDIARQVQVGLLERGARPRVEAERPAPAAQPRPAPRLLGDDGLPLIEPQTAGLLLARAARPAADQRDRLDAARLIHDTPSDLRQLASLVVTHGDPVDVDEWVGHYRSWVAQAETLLAADDDGSVDLRGVRGHACPCCLAVWVTSEQACEVTERTPYGREVFRDPALVIAFRDGQVLHITCRACGAGWWRGDDVQQLAEQIASNTSTYGPAAEWGEIVPRRMDA